MEYFWIYHGDYWDYAYRSTLFGGFYPLLSLAFSVILGRSGSSANVTFSAETAAPSTFRNRRPIFRRPPARPDLGVTTGIKSPVRFEYCPEPLLKARVGEHEASSCTRTEP